MTRHCYSLRFDRKRERYVLRAHGAWSVSAFRTNDADTRRALRKDSIASAVDSWPAKRGVRDFLGSDAIRAAGRLLQALADDLGQRSELFVFGMDGRIVERNSFGGDPRKSRG